MFFSQYWPSLLAILELQEILLPHNLCILLDQQLIDNDIWQFSGVVESMNAKFLTCQR
jgi:hypothetical protein